MAELLSLLLPSDVLLEIGVIVFVSGPFAFGWLFLEFNGIKLLVFREMLVVKVVNPNNSLCGCFEKLNWSRHCLLQSEARVLTILFNWSSSSYLRETLKNRLHFEL